MPTDDLSRLPKLTPQDAQIVILEMLVKQANNLIPEGMMEETGLSIDNFRILERARDRQIEIIKENLRYARERNK